MERITWTRDLIEQYTSIPQLLQDFGCKKIREESNRWTASSPFREDKNPSFYIYKDTLHWEDPGEGKSGSISTLCWETLHVSLASYLNVNLEEKRSNSFLPKKKEEKVRTFIRAEDYRPEDYELALEGTPIEYDLKKIPEAYLYAKSRFMNQEFIDFFHVGFCKNARIYLRKKGENPPEDLIKKNFTNRLCIPIIENGRIVSMEGRDITRHQKEKCIYPASYVGNIGGSSYRSLFNIDNLRIDQPLIVCEGIMDTVRIWQNLTRNVTCTYGSAIKSKQKEELIKFPDVIIFSDSDLGGLSAMKTMSSFYPKEFRVAQLPSGDPGDAENSIFMLNKAIKEAVPCSEWLLRFTGYLSS